MDKFLIIKILYSATSIQGLLLAGLLFRAKVNQPANKILSVLLVLISFHLILVGFDNRDFFMALPHLSRISWIIGTLYGPLVFIFIQYITQTQPDKPWKNFWLFIPFVFLLVVMLPYYMLGAEEKRNLLSDFAAASHEDFGWINQFVSVLHILFQILCITYYLRLERKLYEEYSEVESIRIKWLKQFLIFSLTIVTFGVIIFFAKAWNLRVLEQFYHAHFIGVVFLFYWLSYKALTNPVIFGFHFVGSPNQQQEQSVKQISEKYLKASVSPERLQIIFDEVQHALQSKKLYTKNNLTLSELSQSISIPHHQVSHAINAKFNGNFFDLINDYRVTEFKRLALDSTKKHMTLLGIAQEAGFNSKASFYSIFKKKTGMTPSEYVKSESNPAN